MPVSPADFEFYSRVTGIPIPNDPVARMRMAPQVYAMRRSPMSKVAGALGTAAKAALAGGAAVGAGLLVKELAGRMGDSGETPKTEDVNISSDYSAPSAAEKGPEMSVSEPSARDAAESFVKSVTHGFKQDSGEELVGRAASPEEIAAFRQRISHQTEVPQADPNLANESFDAQRASVGEPVESLTTGMPAQAAPGVETAVAQAVEFFEGSPGKSPFQAGGAMNELGRQSRQVKETVGDLPQGIRGDVARFISNLGSAPSESAVSAAVQAPSSFGGDSFKDQLRRMSERDQIQYKGVKKDGPIEERIAGGVHDTPYSGSENVLGDAPLGGIEASKSMMGEMLQRGNVLPNAGEIMSGMGSAPAPTPEDPLTGDYRAFVSDKGVEIGKLLKQSQEKKESKVTLGDIGQAAFNVVKSAVTGKGAKRAARSAELDRTLAKGLGNLSPEQRAEKRDEILRKEGY